MKDIIQDILNKIELSSTLKSITEKGVEKVVASAVGATIYDLGTIFCLLLLL